MITAICMKEITDSLGKIVCNHLDLVELYEDYDGICLDYGPNNPEFGRNQYYPTITELITCFKIAE